MLSCGSFHSVTTSPPVTCDTSQSSWHRGAVHAELLASVRLPALFSSGCGGTVSFGFAFCFPAEGARFHEGTCFKQCQQSAAGFAPEQRECVVWLLGSSGPSGLFVVETGHLLCALASTNFWKHFSCEKFWPFSVSEGTVVLFLIIDLVYNW